MGECIDLYRHMSNHRHRLGQCKRLHSVFGIRPNHHLPNHRHRLGWSKFLHCFGTDCGTDGNLSRTNHNRPDCCDILHRLNSNLQQQLDADFLRDLHDLRTNSGQLVYRRYSQLE